MRVSIILAVALTSIGANTLNIISSNDDGWAEINIREVYTSLTALGYNVVISAPAQDESGTGSSTGTPTTLTEACEFDSCTSGSPAEGYNSSVPEWNYVNSYPATAIAYGINTLASQFFGAAPDLAVTGVNVGSNLGLAAFLSGTVGAAVEAAQLGIPAVAFSGYTGDQTAWDISPVPDYSQIYAEAAAKLVEVIVASGTPYLPEDIWLNVNFPAAGSGTDCTSSDDIEFVMSRLYAAIPLISGADAVTCDNGGRLPTETTVANTDGCYASISVGSATDKLDADQADQTTVLNKLESILVCLS
ncbi:survival protein sure-like phosphatase/nucleotidase [Xylariales sp. PMI_506]|nr:survival protein sure-like phosphatase/nucleotidase [Xylariales sp. PMI_506]